MKCEDCGGTGADSGALAEPEACPSCKGSGVEPEAKEGIKVVRTRKASHPFEGGRKTSGITRQHVPLVWECILGTVEARNPVTGEEKYFDYDWDGAREFAQVAKARDLRIAALPLGRVGITPGGRHVRSHGKLKLYGIFDKEQV